MPASWQGLHSCRIPLPFQILSRKLSLLTLPKQQPDVKLDYLYVTVAHC